MKDSKKNPTMVLGIIAITCAALGFFGGMKYQQTKSPSFARGGQNNIQQGMGQNNGQTTKGTGITKNTKNGAGIGGGVQVGTISAIDDTSITLKLQDGSSKIIILSGTTEYTTTTDASKSNLDVGITVAISGTINTDGSVTAKQVQVNPAMMNALSDTPRNTNTEPINPAK